MAFRSKSQHLFSRILSSPTAKRTFHSSRPVKAGDAPPWGTDVNEPGGRLFGEAILKPGERRKLYAWEVPFYTTTVLAALIVGIGLSSRPVSKMHVEIEKEAQRRVAALGLDDDDE